MGVNINYSYDDSQVIARIYAMHRKNFSTLESEHIDGNIIFIHDENKTYAHYDDNCSTLYIYGRHEDFSSGRALYYIAVYMAECIAALKNNRIIIHASAAYSNKTRKSYILLGEKGSGKTTLLYYLCKNLGLEFICNDHAVISSYDNKLFLHGGDKFFRFRETAVKLSNYAEIKTYKKNFLPSWNNKEEISPSELGIKIHETISNVKNIYHIRIDSQQEETFNAIWSGTQQSLLLHEKLGREITGQTAPFVDDYGKYFGSLPLINLHKTLPVRDSLVQLLIKTGIREIFANSVENIVSVIKEDII